MALQSTKRLSLRDQVLFEAFSRGSQVDIPHDVVHHAFEATVDAHPIAMALRDYNSGTFMTYTELELRANVLANYLIRRGLGKGQRVCLVFSRGVEMVVSILAVLKAGAQYVPLDGGVVTDETLEFIISDTSAEFVLYLHRFAEKVAKVAPEDACLVDLDGPTASAIWKSRQDDGRPAIRVGSQDGAYVIYTSGTTGKPKGVDVRHEGVTNTLLAEPSKLRIRPGKNVGQVLSVSFDMGVWEILGTLMNGGTLHLRSSDWSLCLRQIDTLIATPSVLAKFKQTDYPNIKTIAVGGEPCPTALADEWAAYADFWNVCGPTEISILNTGHLHKRGSQITIGRPNPNTNVYVLDENDEPTRIGEPGVMWVGGPGVSRGYLNLPELTARRYKTDKFSQDGRMMFNTGDLGRWRDDGKLEHLGRKDEQIKIKGFRVELDGVSAAMERFEDVTKACALLIDEELWGVYSADTQVDEEALKASVAKLMPYYAVPTQWRWFQKLDLTANGKVDKRALKRIVVDGEYTRPESVRKAGNIMRNSEATLASQCTADTGKGSQTSSITVMGNDARASTSTPVPPIEEVTQPEQAYLGVPTHQTPLTITALEAPEQQRTREFPKELPKEFTKEQTTVTEYRTDPEKGMAVDTQVFELPPKNGCHGQRWLRHKFFSMYRRFFSVIFLSNLAGFAWILSQSIINKRSLPIPDLTAAVAANLMASVLMRQDHVVNFLFWAAIQLPTSWPLCIRRQAARVFHIGGVHSGCAISATMWWVVFTAAASINFGNGDQEYPINGGTIVLTYMVLFLLVCICVMALPKIRSTIHDQFEWMHRFAGWTALGFVWAHVIVATHSVSKVPLGEALKTSPAVWMLAVITLSIVLPWARVRKVKVESEPLSRHAVRLHFDFCTPETGKGVRITDRPLAEWHAFAAIPTPKLRGFSLIVSRAGDWTGRIIDKPPKEIYTRGVPASGVLTIAPLFKKMVLVATGSGIGPCLPVILEGRVPVRILWSTPHPVETFGQEIIDAIMRADPNAIIWNTRTQGKPDLTALTYQMYQESGAEAVGVISNKKLTQGLVYQMESRGVPAYGPVFDS